MDKETTRRLGWVYGEWRPGLRDSERELSGEGCEQCLNCWGGGISGGVPQRWRVSLSVSNETRLPVSDAGMVRGVPGRGWVGESHTSEDGVEVRKME